MNTTTSISVIVPVYNEEGTIAAAISSITREMKGITNDYEILVINDGSRDTTPEIIRNLMKKNRHIRFIDRKVNKGFGYTVKEGFINAKKAYITQFHGDNDSSTTFIKELIKQRNTADILSTYPTDTTVRSSLRRLLSSIFIRLMNLLFRMHLKYFNGAFICKTKLLKSLMLTSKGFAIYAEVKVRLVNRGYTIAEIPFTHTGRSAGVTKAVNMKSVIQTIETILNLVGDIYIFHKP